VPVQIFKTRSFGRFSDRERIADRTLREAIERAERGLIDADLGGGLIKQRIGRRGEGRSGGYLIAFRTKHRAVFLYGFAKNERDNIGPNELLSFRRLGQGWLAADANQLKESLADESIAEVDGDPKE
jgi:hypothetical protein